MPKTAISLRFKEQLDLIQFQFQKSGLFPVIKLYFVNQITSQSVVHFLCDLSIQKTQLFQMVDHYSLNLESS